MRKWIETQIKSNLATFENLGICVFRGVCPNLASCWLYISNVDIYSIKKPDRLLLNLNLLFSFVYFSFSFLFLNFVVGNNALDMSSKCFIYSIQILRCHVTFVISVKILALTYPCALLVKGRVGWGGVGWGGRNVCPYIEEVVQMYYCVGWKGILLKATTKIVLLYQSPRQPVPFDRPLFLPLLVAAKKINLFFSAWNKIWTEWYIVPSPNLEKKFPKEVWYMLTFLITSKCYSLNLSYRYYV